MSNLSEAISNRLDLVAPTYGDSDCLFAAPTKSKSGKYSAIWHSVLIAPFMACFCQTIYFNSDNCSSIFILLRDSGPSAIVWAVAFIVVNPIYRMFARRLYPHIVKKIFKRIPSGTNSYSSAAVIFVPLVGFAKASFTHRYPGSKFTGWGSVFRLPVRSICKRGTLFLKASAAFRVPTSKICSSHKNFISAVTLAFPETNLPTFFSKRKCSEPFKFNTSQFYTPSHFKSPLARLYSKGVGLPCLI